MHGKIEKLCAIRKKKTIAKTDKFFAKNRLRDSVDEICTLHSCVCYSASTSATNVVSWRMPFTNLRLLLHVHWHFVLSFFFHVSSPWHGADCPGCRLCPIPGFRRRRLIPSVMDDELV